MAQSLAHQTLERLGRIAHALVAMVGRVPECSRGRPACPEPVGTREVVAIAAVLANEMAAARRAMEHRERVGAPGRRPARMAPAAGQCSPGGGWAPGVVGRPGWRRLKRLRASWTRSQVSWSIPAGTRVG